MKGGEIYMKDRQPHHSGMPDADYLRMIALANEARVPAAELVMSEAEQPKQPTTVWIPPLGGVPVDPVTKRTLAGRKIPY